MPRKNQEYVGKIPQSIFWIHALLINSNRVFKFSPFSEISDQEIICVQGTENHYMATSMNDHVFGPRKKTKFYSEI